MNIIPIAKMPSIAELKGIGGNNDVSGNSSSVPFADIFKEIVAQQQKTAAVSENDARELALGNIDDLHTVMINSERAAAALELTVQMTSRALGAYNEIIRMQI